MREKGFTLIELVCVILLLAIIISLSTIAIVNVVQNSKERENKASMELIKTAVNDYIDKYENDFHIENGVTYCIDVQDLIDENLLISNISYDGEKINEKTVKTEYNNNNYSYKLDDKETCMISETKKYEITNLVSNGSFENGTTDWSGDVMTISDDTSSSGTKSLYIKDIDENHNFWYTQTINNISVGDKIYYTLKSKVLNGRFNIILDDDNGTSLPARESSEFVKISSIYSSKHDTFNVQVGSSYAVIGEGYIDDVIIINLTETFGAGNEPSKDWCDEHINYFDGTTVIYK